MTVILLGRTHFRQDEKIVYKVKMLAAHHDIWLLLCWVETLETLMFVSAFNKTSQRCVTADGIVTRILTIVGKSC